jgi:hypothetical protein
MSRRAFRGLVESFRGSSGPIKVVWVGQAFEWFRIRQAFTYGEEPHEYAPPFHPPNAAFLKLELISKLGVTVLPTLWRTKATGSPSARHLREASELARFTGGKVHVCATHLADCLPDVLNQANDGLVVRVEGPQVRRRRGLLPQVLEIRYASGSGSFGVSRPWATGEELPETHDTDQFDEAPMGVLLADRLPAGQSTCTSAHHPGQSVSVTVPSRILTASRMNLRAIVEVEGGNRVESGLKLRAEVSVSTVGAETSDVCVDLAAMPETAQRMRLVVFSPEHNWAGIAPIGRVTEP